jgi:hypothetical protein
MLRPQPKEFQYNHHPVEGRIHGALSAGKEKYAQPIDTGFWLEASPPAARTLNTFENLQTVCFTSQVTDARKCTCCRWYVVAPPMQFFHYFFWIYSLFEVMCWIPEILAVCNLYSACMYLYPAFRLTGYWDGAVQNFLVEAQSLCG